MLSHLFSHMRPLLLCLLPLKPNRPSANKRAKKEEEIVLSILIFLTQNGVVSLFILYEKQNTIQPMKSIGPPIFLVFMMNIYFVISSNQLNPSGLTLMLIRKWKCNSNQTSYCLPVFIYCLCKKNQHNYTQITLDQIKSFFSCLWIKRYFTAFYRIP